MASAEEMLTVYPVGMREKCISCCPLHPSEHPEGRLSWAAVNVNKT